MHLEFYKLINVIIKEIICDKRKFKPVAGTNDDRTPPVSIEHVGRGLRRAGSRLVERFFHVVVGLLLLKNALDVEVLVILSWNKSLLQVLVLICTSRGVVVQAIEQQ